MTNDNAALPYIHTQLSNNQPEIPPQPTTMADNTPRTAVAADNLSIPLIDFSAFLSSSPPTKKATADAILAGFQNAGFIYLHNHPIAPDLLAQTFAESAAFFRRPAAQKLALAWTTPQANRGYSQPGREKTSAALDAEDVAAQREREGADLKESFEIGREGAAGCPNRWPDDSDDEGGRFKARMLEFHDRCKEVHVLVMRAIAVGLGLEEGWFDGFCDRGDNTLRLLHYPEVSAEVFRGGKGTVRAGAHSDYGSITLVSASLFPRPTSIDRSAPRRCEGGARRRLSEADSSSRTSAAACRCSRRGAPSSTRRPSRAPLSSTPATCWRAGPTTRSRAPRTASSSRLRAPPCTPRATASRTFATPTSTAGSTPSRARTRGRRPRSTRASTGGWEERCLFEERGLLFD